MVEIARWSKANQLVLAMLLFSICYGFSSCMRSIGGGLCQFWPILMPVCRAQVFAGYVPTCCQLNRQATAYRDRPNTSGPLPYKLWLGVNCAGQPGLTAVQGKISGELHSFSISDSLNQMQAKNEAWRIFFNLSASLLIKS